MKKIMLIQLILIIGLSSSCSNDDTTTETTDPFVGTWFLSSVLIDNIVQTISNCDELDQITAFENGFYYALDFNDNTGECIAFVSDAAVQVMPNEFSIVLTDYPNAIWENIGDGAYTLQLEETASTLELIFESDTSFSFFEFNEGSTRKYIYTRESAN